eukprot:112454-Chlamydomonas_euryale.AAC.3
MLRGGGLFVYLTDYAIRDTHTSTKCDSWRWAGRGAPPPAFTATLTPTMATECRCLSFRRVRRATVQVSGVCRSERLRSPTRDFLRPRRRPLLPAVAFYLHCHCVGRALRWPTGEGHVVALPAAPTPRRSRRAQEVLAEAVRECAFAVHSWRRAQRPGSRRGGSARLFCVCLSLGPRLYGREGHRRRAAHGRGGDGKGGASQGQRRSARNGRRRAGARGTGGLLHALLRLQERGARRRLHDDQAAAE